jgi:IS5 family transposase
VLTDRRPSLAVVDRGYRGHGVETTRVLIRGLTLALAKLLRRGAALSSRRSAT